MIPLERQELTELLQNLKIAVLSGGPGEEREISLRSGENVFNALCGLGLSAVKIDPAENFIDQIREVSPALICNCLHGAFGEDGTVQAVLDTLAFPYTGENMLSSAISFNKIRTKEILRANGIFTSPHIKVPNNYALLNENLGYHLDFPVVFKPESSGSSCGIFLINNSQELKECFENNFADMQNKNTRFFVEQYIAGTEITVGVLEYDNTIYVLPILEIRPKKAFYDYEAKYTKGMTELIIPASIPVQTADNVIDISRKIYRFMHYRGCVRIDYIIDKNGILWALEINTQPGMTETSDIPFMLEKEGNLFSDLPLIACSQCLKKKKN